MIPTKVTRTLALAGFTPAGKLSHSYHSLLPVLALSLATAAWSQSTLVPKGPHRPLSMSGVTPSAKPAADTPASAQYKFITIGVPGSANAQAYSINNALLVSGFYEDASSSSVYHGFVWQNGVLQTVDYPGALYTYLWQVNNQGVAIGYYGDGTTEHTVTYSVSSGTWTALPDIPGSAENEGYGINDAGVAIGNAYSANLSTNVAWIWHPGTSTYSFFAVPGAAQYTTYPDAINDKGQIVGFFNDSSGVTHGFLEQGGTYSTIDVPGATNTFPYGINNSGAIGGDQEDAVNVQQGYVETSEGLFTTVDYPGPSITAVEGINDHGDVCGTYVEDPSGARRAFIWLRP
jgi:probable HAF family extracellular repeat protein